MFSQYEFMYHEPQMRRSLSILLVVLFWLAPLAALLPGSDEARLPACCRRHGVHHCTMSADTAGAATDTGHHLSAPSRCPRYPGSPPASQSAFALAQPTLHT